MNRKTRISKATRSEEAYVRRMDSRSSLDIAKNGDAEVLVPDDYPEPLRRFLIRERGMVHVKLPVATRRRLEAQSRKLGLSADQLARRWIEQHLRNTG